MEDFLKTLYLIKLSELDISELEDVTISLSKNFVILTSCLKDEKPLNFNENVLLIVKNLKISCSKGSTLQGLVANTNGFVDSTLAILQSNCDENIKQKVCQLIGNLTVQNAKVQKKLWPVSCDFLMEKFTSTDFEYINIAGMIIYNTILNSPEIVDSRKILRECLKHYERYLDENSSIIPDFLHVLLEFFICEFEDIVSYYEELEDDFKKVLLYYVHDHVENDSNPTIHTVFLIHLILEFKKKSDCVLKTVANYVDQIDPIFVVILLDIISSATTHVKYLTLLKDDRALFLNMGCLLQALHKLGKRSDNIFTPIQKLDALVPTSSEPSSFEKEVSFSFKTKLIKSMANLSYRNKRNQDIAREMEIMPSIFECTNADARNPLIKEWSILAIRNLCEDNPENQEVVRNLTRVGNADNPVLSEFKLDDGIFRINK